jgi:hypothetical protein
MRVSLVTFESEEYNPRRGDDFNGTKSRKIAQDLLPAGLSSFALTPYSLQYFPTVVRTFPSCTSVIAAPHI